MFNVPRNNELAVVDPPTEQGSCAWLSYVKSWTMWNHVRTASALAAAAVLMIAIT
jgi:uncharacterized membrane protein